MSEEREAQPDTLLGDQLLDDTIQGVSGAHATLLATLEQLDDRSVRAPSRLPGWSVGHVLTHVARNADSFVRILDAAGRGEAVEQYAGGPEQRAADIEAGAGRSRDELVGDVKRSAIALEGAWKAASPEVWDGHGLAGGRTWPCRQLPFHRWREVEVHHVDLGVGYGPGDWPQAYVAHELPRALATVPERLTDPASRALLLAWLLDRGPLPQPLELEVWGARREIYFARRDRT